LRGRKPCSRAPHSQLRRLAAGELWADLRRALSNAIHAEISPHHRRQYEHGLAGATLLPTESSRGAARSDLAFSADSPLHLPFPLSHGGRIWIVFEDVRPAEQLKTQSRADCD